MWFFLIISLRRSCLGSVSRSTGPLLFPYLRIRTRWPLSYSFCAPICLSIHLKPSVIPTGLFQCMMTIPSSFNPRVFAGHLYYVVILYSLILFFFVKKCCKCLTVQVELEHLNNTTWRSFEKKQMPSCIDALHKWRLNLNNNTWYILSPSFMFQDKGNSHECEAKDVLSIVIEI